MSAECAELSLEHPRGHDPRPTRWRRVMLPSTPRMQDGAARGRRSRYLRLGKPMLCQRELAPQDGAGRTNRTLSSRVGAELVTMTCPTSLRGPSQPVRKRPLPRKATKLGQVGQDFARKVPILRKNPPFGGRFRAVRAAGASRGTTWHHFGATSVIGVPDPPRSTPRATRQGHSRRCPRWSWRSPRPSRAYAR